MLGKNYLWLDSPARRNESELQIEIPADFFFSKSHYICNNAGRELTGWGELCWKGVWGLSRQQIEHEPAECPGSRENQPQTGLINKSTDSGETRHPPSSLLSGGCKENTAPVVLSSAAPQQQSGVTTPQWAQWRGAGDWSICPLQRGLQNGACSAQGIEGFGTFFCKWGS